MLNFPVAGSVTVLIFPSFSFSIAAFTALDDPVVFDFPPLFPLFRDRAFRRTAAALL
jgi:hypothetical protein